VERFAGRYALLRRLGGGGMGEVFLAREVSSDFECALKRLSASLAALAPDTLRREFEALTRVRHPAVVAVHELAFAPDGTPYMTMEYVPGLPADQALGPGGGPPLLFVAAQIAHGLEALHAQQVVHGDLKPSNVLVIRGNAPGGLPAGVRLLDFGLAGLAGRAGQGHSGTPGFAAPEVVRGEAPTPSADLYGLGATLYELIAGRPAFEGANPLSRQRQGSPPALPLEESGASAALVRLVLRLMADDPAERFRDAREVRRELERLGPAARRPLAERLRSAVLVGRERELGRLERWMAAPRARVVFVSGAAGSGKTALLGELAARSALIGRTVIALSCAGGTGATARVLLRRLAAAAGEDPDQTVRSATARAFLRSSHAALATEDLDELTEAAARWSAALGAVQRPPIALLDDAEALDAGSRALVRRLALHPETPPLLWVWALRRRPDNEDEGVMLRAGLAEHIELEALEAGDVERLAASRLHEPAPGALIEFLLERANGHPGLTVELLHAAVAAGAVREQDTGVAVDPAALAAVRAPADFEASLLDRHAALSEGARRAAAALAVIGEPAPAAALCTVAPGSETGIEELVDAGLASRDGGGAVALMPPAIAERLLEPLGESARRELHRAALELPGLTQARRFHHLERAGDVSAALQAAEAAFSEHPDERLAAAAADLAEKLDTAAAALWHERAGTELASRGRYAVALPHFERALSLESSGSRRAFRWERLSTCQLRAGRPADVERVNAAALAEELPQAFRALILVNEATRLATLGNQQRAAELAREALALAREARDSQAIGFAAAALASTLIQLGQLEEAEQCVAEAQEAFRRAAHIVGQVRALIIQASLARRRQDLVTAEARYQEANEVARAHRNRLAREEALASLGVLRVESGRWEGARQTIEEAARIAAEDARPNGLAVALTNRSILEGLIGDAPRALDLARRAARMTHAYLPGWRPLAWRSVSQAYRIAGRSKAAERAARVALRLAHRTGRHDLDWCRFEYGRCLVMRDRWTEAERVWIPTISPRRDVDSFPEALSRLLAAWSTLRRDDLAASMALLEPVERWLERGSAPYPQAFVWLLQAGLAFRRGQTTEGCELGKRALEAFAALPALADRSFAALELARLMPRDEAARTTASIWLDQAAASFERLGDRRSQRRSLQLAIEWLRAAPAPAAVAPDERSLLERVSWLLQSLTDVRKLTQRAMQAAVEHLDAERGVLVLADPESGELTIVAQEGAMDATARSNALGFSRRVVQSVTKTGSSLLVGDAPSDPRVDWDSVRDMRLQSILCVPMFLGGRVIGAVYVDDSRRAGAFGEDERGLLEGFAHLMAVAIENARGQQEVQQVRDLLEDENLALRQAITTRYQPHNVIGSSEPMQRVLTLVEHAARTNTTVLITGDSGTGKELIARTLHHTGKRKLKPFIGVNCGAFPESLLESELFGILQHVATGVRARSGKFVQADGGTLFLDEVGDMPLKQQVAMLAALENREVTPVGGVKPIPVDVRIVAASNRDLRRMVDQGTFRDDLFYRLNVIEIEMPALRERKADIRALAQHFLAHFAQEQEREAPRMSPEFIAALMQSDWPGNVRELRNYIERMMAMTPGRVLVPRPLPPDLERRGAIPRIRRGRRLAETVDEVERKLVAEALARAKGNQSHAARDLGMTEQSMRYRIRKYGLNPSRQNRRPRRK
jgi:Nif-specific regulatory protein